MPASLIRGSGNGRRRLRDPRRAVPLAGAARARPIVPEGVAPDPAGVSRTGRADRLDLAGDATPAAESVTRALCHGRFR